MVEDSPAGPVSRGGAGLCQPPRTIETGWRNAGQLKPLGMTGLKERAGQRRWAGGRSGGTGAGAFGLVGVINAQDNAPASTPGDRPRVGAQPSFLHAPAASAAAPPAASLAQPPFPYSPPQRPLHYPLRHSPSHGTVASSIATASTSRSVLSWPVDPEAEAEGTPRSSASYLTHSSSAKGKGKATATVIAGSVEACSRIQGLEEEEDTEEARSPPHQGRLQRQWSDSIELAPLDAPIGEPRPLARPGVSAHDALGSDTERPPGAVDLERADSQNAVDEKLHTAGVVFMADSKDAPGVHSFASTHPTSHGQASTVHSGVSRSTAASRTPLLPSDAETQARLAFLGYTQEVNRDWDLWSSVALTTLNLGTTQGAFWGIVTVMSYGGPVVLTLGYPVSIVVMTAFAATMGEFASAFPVAGAMFTWTFKLARGHKALRDWARFLSWITGSFLLVAHVLVQVVMAWQLSTTLQGTVAAAGIPWQFKSWQQYLIVLGSLGVCCVIACLPITRSPRFWKASGVLAFALYVTIGSALLATARQRRPVSEAFGQYVNGTKFSSKGFVFLLGWVYTTIVVGVESSAHLAEETKSPAKTVPRAMFFSTVIGNLMGWVMMVVVIVTLPIMPEFKEADAVSSVVAGSHTLAIWLPAQLIFRNCPAAVAKLVLCSLLLLMSMSAVAQMYAASRFAWALARDKALPFAHVFRKVSGTAKVPRAATVLIAGASMVVALLTLLTAGHGGMIFVNAVFTSALWFFLLAYITPTAIYLACPEDVLQFDGRNVWNLRALSRPLSWLWVAFVAFALVLISCPNGTPVRLETWSWSPVFVFVMFLATILTWMFYGNSHYAGPIKSITVWTTGQAVDLPKERDRSEANIPPEKQQTTTAAKGRTAAVYEGSLPTQAMGTLDAGVTECTGSGWTEGTETGEWSDGDEEDTRRGHAMEAVGR